MRSVALGVAQKVLNSHLQQHGDTLSTLQLLHCAMPYLLLIEAACVPLLDPPGLEPGPARPYGGPFEFPDERRASQEAPGGQGALRL